MISPKYIVGDARRIEKLLSFRGYKNPNLIVTSPPYYDVKNYENAENQIGHSQTYDNYLVDVSNIFQQCYNMSSDEATLWVVVDMIRKNGEIVPIPFDITNYLKANYNNTWILKDIIIWNKYKTLPWNNKGQLRKQYEYILFYVKNDRYKYNVDKIREIADYKKWWRNYPERYNFNGKPPSNIWEFNIPLRGWGNGSQKHICPLPFPLIERIISLSTDKGDTVLDPFAGSGSVVALANEMGRNAIGIDINIKYKDMYEKEVILGAKKYWANRKLELVTVGENIGYFKNINLKLRTMKACTRIMGYVNRNGYRNIFVLDYNENSHNAILHIVSKKYTNWCRIVKSDIKKYVNDINKEYKLDIQIVPTMAGVFEKNNICENNLYGYTRETIYRHKTIIKYNKNIHETVDAQYVYSNIKMNIEVQKFFGIKN